jgi:formate hydrogenlyase subunit 4
MAALDLLLRLLATILHAALVFALAPLVMGLVATLRARLLGRRGPPPLQPYLTLLKLIRKTTLVPDNATEFYPVWPYLAFAPIAAAALLVPGFCAGLLTAGLSDMITIIGLLALSRAAIILAGLETGFGFGGAGAARDILFGIFAEAALLVTVLTFVLIAHSPTVDGIAAAFRDNHIGIQVSLGFALAATFMVALTETGRIPVDNPAGHLELAMVHEAMLLEYSGKNLALFEATAMLRLTVWMSLIATIFCPFGIGRAVDILSWPAGLALWLIKLVALSAGLAVFELSSAKMRIFRVPEFLGVAILLGLLSAVFLFLAQRIGS